MHRCLMGKYNLKKKKHKEEKEAWLAYLISMMEEMGEVKLYTYCHINF